MMDPDLFPTVSGIGVSGRENKEIRHQYALTDSKPADMHQRVGFYTTRIETTVNKAMETLSKCLYALVSELSPKSSS